MLCPAIRFMHSSHILVNFSCAAAQARRYERDLDARLAAFAKVCSTSRADFQRKGDTGLAAEQASFLVLQSTREASLGAAWAVATMTVQEGML